jgi:hypothetical protein
MSGQFYIPIVLSLGLHPCNRCVGGLVGPTTGLGMEEKIAFVTSPGPELRTLGRPAGG